MDVDVNKIMLSVVRSQNEADQDNWIQLKSMFKYNLFIKEYDCPFLSIPSKLLPKMFLVISTGGI